MTKRRMLAGLVTVAAGASAATAAVLAGVGGAGQAQSGSVAVSRVERTFPAHDWGWRACSIDACGGQTLVVTTPTDVAVVDVVATISLTYWLGRGEPARARLGYVAEPIPIDPPVPCCADPPTTLLKPGLYRLSGPGPTSTTLTWIKRGLPAAGKRYDFFFSLYPSPSAMSAVTSKTTVVIETWSAGN